MKNIPFVKVVGSGNDFILMDARRKALTADPARLARSWCDRKRGIGADGLLWVTRSPRAAARMRIFNADGSEAEMCGNGLRCVAWYLHARNPRVKQMDLETEAGILAAQITQRERVKIQWRPPHGFRLGLKITLQGRRLLLHAVNTGVPHAVLWGSRIGRLPLESWGPAIRHHRFFKPAGTNVDLAQIHSRHRLSLRTYERGVEAQTLACGTGAVAAVVIGAALGKLLSPVEVVTAGKEILRVGFHRAVGSWEGLYLEGPAQIRFQGDLPQ